MKKLISFLKRKNYNKSFSQCGEDIIVDFIFKNLLKINNPSYLDIGANHPTKFNNTFKLYKGGSHGINIDPNHELISLFNKIRKKDINLQIGIGKESTVKTLFRFNNSMLNTFDEKVANINGDIVSKDLVKIKTINEIINSYNDSIFPDFLSLDTEGMDLEILSSIEFDLRFPKVICVETVKKINNNKYIKNKEILDFLKNKNYIHHSDTFINSIFIHPSSLKISLKW